MKTSDQKQNKRLVTESGVQQVLAKPLSPLSLSFSLEPLCPSLSLLLPLLFAPLNPLPLLLLPLPPTLPPPLPPLTPPSLDPSLHSSHPPPPLSPPLLLPFLPFSLSSSLPSPLSPPLSPPLSHSLTLSLFLTLSHSLDNHWIQKATVTKESNTAWIIRNPSFLSGTRWRYSNKTRNDGRHTYRVQYNWINMSFTRDVLFHGILQKQNARRKAPNKARCGAQLFFCFSFFFDPLWYCSFFVPLVLSFSFLLVFSASFFPGRRSHSRQKTVWATNGRARSDHCRQTTVAVAQKGMERSESSHENMENHLTRIIDNLDVLTRTAKCFCREPRHYEGAKTSSWGKQPRSMPEWLCWKTHS